MAPIKLPDTVEECHALILRLLARIEEQDRLLAEQARRIEELERRLNQNSQNSSRPPSSDPPSAPRRTSEQPRSGRKPGGQRGHRGHHRETVTPDRTEDHWPTQCEQCQHQLPQGVRTEVGDPQRHQVTELPEVVATVTEHVLHTQQCPTCDWATPCSWPEGVPAGAFGPRLTAVVGVLTGVYKMSTRTAAEAVRDLFGASMSLGSVVACEQATSKAVAQPVDAARAFVQTQTVAHADETGWREQRQKAWLWVMATTFVIVFAIHRRRSRDAARSLLGSFSGTLVSDRWPVYQAHEGPRQICWSHLARDFESLAEYDGKIGKIGRRLQKLTGRMFGWWHRVRDGTMTRTRFQANMRPLRREIEDLLRNGVECAQERASGMCWDIGGKHSDALWTFVDFEGVQPTNNHAERALRHAVLWRKSSFGTHSEAGSRFVERMLTVRATLRAQRRNVVQYVTQAVMASLRRLPPPSILPDSAQALTPA